MFRRKPNRLETLREFSERMQYRTSKTSGSMSKKRHVHFSNLCGKVGKIWIFPRRFLVSVCGRSLAMLLRNAEHMQVTFSMVCAIKRAEWPSKAWNRTDKTNRQKHTIVYFLWKRLPGGWLILVWVTSASLRAQTKYDNLIHSRSLWRLVCRCFMSHSSKLYWRHSLGR